MERSWESMKPPPAYVVSPATPNPRQVRLHLHTLLCLPTLLALHSPPSPGQELCVLDSPRNRKQGDPEQDAGPSN